MAPTKAPPAPPLRPSVYRLAKRNFDYKNGGLKEDVKVTFMRNLKANMNQWREDVRAGRVDANEGHEEWDWINELGIGLGGKAGAGEKGVEVEEGDKGEGDKGSEFSFVDEEFSVRKLSTVSDKVRKTSISRTASVSEEVKERRMSTASNRVTKSKSKKAVAMMAKVGTSKKITAESVKAKKDAKKKARKALKKSKGKKLETASTVEVVMKDKEEMKESRSTSRNKKKRERKLKRKALKTGGDSSSSSSVSTPVTSTVKKTKLPTAEEKVAIKKVSKGRKRREKKTARQLAKLDSELLAYKNQGAISEKSITALPISKVPALKETRKSRRWTTKAKMQQISAQMSTAAASMGVMASMPWPLGGQYPSIQLQPSYGLGTFNPGTFTPMTTTYSSSHFEPLLSKTTATKSLPKNKVAKTVSKVVKARAMSKSQILPKPISDPTYKSFGSAAKASFQGFGGFGAGPSFASSSEKAGESLKRSYTPTLPSNYRITGTAPYGGWRYSEDEETTEDEKEQGMMVTRKAKKNKSKHVTFDESPRTPPREGGEEIGVPGAPTKKKNKTSIYAKDDRSPKPKWKAPISPTGETFAKEGASQKRKRSVSATSPSTSPKKQKKSEHSSASSRDTIQGTFTRAKQPPKTSVRKTSRAKVPSTSPKPKKAAPKTPKTKVLPVREMTSLEYYHSHSTEGVQTRKPPTIPFISK